MNPALIPVLAGGSAIALLALIIRLAIRQGARARRNVQHLAANLGISIEPPTIVLGFFPSAPRASGERRGKWVEVYSYTTGSGKSRTYWCAFSAKPIAHGGLTFELTRQGWGTKLMSLFGVKEIQIGDPAFDAAWFIKTNQPEFFRAALLPELRVKLDAAAKEGRRGKFKLDQGKVIYAEAGGSFDERRCARFEMVADIVCDLADVAEVFASRHTR